MKVKVKKSLEVPPEIKAFTDKALSTPFEQLGQLFAGFQFNYSKGDFHHWVPLFNYLDDYFEKGLQPRADLQLDVANGLQARVPFPVANVNAVLQFTATVLENCSNKHLYGSHDHLGSLLAAPHTSVVLNALQTLVAFVRKTHSSSSRLQASAGINNRLLALCHGWGGKEQGLGLLACASQTQDAVEQGHSQATTLRYVFHDASRPGSASGSQPQQGAAPGNSVELRNLHRFSEDDFQILTAITRGHELSMDERFVLLCKIRTTRLFGSLEGRQALVSIRLLAFYVLVQSSPSQEEVASFFSNEPEFVGELVSLLQAEKEVPEPIRVLALRSLAVQLMERSRHASVISTISAGGQSGLLSLMMHRSVAALVRPHQVPDRYSLSFVEALLSLIGALVASTTGCSALAEAGLVPALLPLIKDMDPDHVRLVSSCIHILETFMDYSPNAASLFRDLGGLDDMIFRLRAEIGLSTDPSSSQEARHAMQDTKPPPVPYHRRVLLKSLLRAIALASYAPGTATRPDEAESRALYQCLRAIFERATEFGGGLFALAASVMTDLIHHDPLCFRELDAAGLPDAFIAAIKAGVIPSGEAVCSVPNTLVAICLNTGGLTKVSESGALDCFIPILTSKTYLKALQGDTPSVLGAGLDELLRHVTSLRKNGVSMILQVFRTLCAEGGTEIAPQPLPEEGDQSMETEGGASAAEGAAPAAEGTAMDVEASEAGQQAAETAAQAASPDQPALQPASPSGDVDMTGPSQEGDAAASRTQQPGAPAEQPAPAVSAGPSAPEPPSALPQQDVESPDHLPECISHAARMLDNMSANAETSRLFIQQGGIELLLALYRLPRLPPTFGSSSAAHALTATFRTLTMQHAQPLSKHLSSVLNQQLDQALQSAKEIGDQNVPTMPAKERDAYIRLISSTEGLICLAAAVARNAQHMLLEVSAGATSIITRIGEVERVVLWQACHSSHPPADEQFQTFGALAEEERAEELQQQAGQGPMGLQLHNNADPQGLTTAAPGNGHILPAPAAIAEALAAGGDADMASAAAEPRDGLVDASEPASPGDRQDEEGQQTGRARRKTQQALAYEVLVHFTIQIRAFYTAVAKAIQTPVRRREELGTSPTMAMRAAAINMAVVLRQNMRYKMLPAPPNVVFGSDLINKKHPRTAVLRQLNYTTRLLEEMMMVLVDGRRRTCHTLVLNYLVVGHGFTTFLDHFKLVLAWMWTMKESLAPVKHLLKHVPADWIGVHPAATMVKLERMAATPEGVAKFNALPDLSEAHALNCFVNVLEAMTEGMLGGLEQLTHASMVLASPQADTLLVAPVPGAPPIPEGQPAPTAQAFVKQLQSSVLAAVMPIWGHYLLPTCCGPMCNMVQITEMGFSQPRAEEALRRVGHNSVELAMEWLIAHPEDPAAAGGAADAAAAASAEGDEAQLAQALAASLKAGELSKNAAEEDAQSLKAMLTPIQLVRGAIAVMECVPDAAFGLSDLVANLCQRDDGKLRNQILEQILINLRGDQSIEMEVNSRSPTNLLAAAHLLALLLTEHNEVKKTTVAPGFVKCSLQLLTAQPLANGAADQGPATQPGNLLDSMRDSLVKTLEEQHRPGGLLSPEQQDLAAMICIRLLQHVQSRGPDYQRTMSETYHAGTEAAPKSTAHSCLQLLSRLTTRHEIALKVLREKGHRLALDLPVSALGPELEPYMTALMRHILEDPATLQAAMEAEIRSTLASQRNSPSGMPGQSGSAPLHSFLQTLTPVLARDPTIFVNAMAATCKLEEAQSNLLGSGRVMVTLKSPIKAAQPPAPAGPSGGEQGAQQPKTPLPAAQTPQPAGPPPDTGIVRRPSSLGGSNRGTPKAGERATPFKASAMKPGKKLVPASFAEAALAETAAAEEAKTKAKRKAANRIEQSRVRQCIFFKMLTEFTLKYGNCIGVLLKADTSASSSRDTAKTPVKAERSAGGTVFRQLMFTYLVGLPPGNAVAAAMAEHCSFFLLAVCIRSAEGRNRIVSEIVKTLRGDNAPELPTTSPPESLPFRDAPHQPSPMLLKPFVDLAGSLLQALQPSPNNRSLGPATGLFHEMILTMRKAGITKAIINSIRLIDMEHPGAAKMATQENGNVPAPAAHPGPESAAAAGAAGPSQGDAQMTEVEAEQESAAGPDALAAAEHAWAEQGRSDRGRGGRMPRSMDAMIEDILEQAYEEGMQAYDDHHLSEGESGSDGDDMSDDEDMHDDDDEASPSLESDHDHGESGEEDDDDGEDDDDDDEDGVSSDDSLSDHSFDHIDGGGDTDADAEATGQVVIRDEEQDLLRLGEEVARFTDADLGMDMGMGMREEDEEDEHMQGMGDDDDQGSEGEEEDEDEEVDEEDAITDDEAAFEDGDEPSIWDDHRVIGGRDEEDGDEMVAPRWAGMQRLPGTSNLHPAQVMQELLGNLTGQVATDRRRFRIISSRQGGRPQGPAPTMPAAAAPVQHRLLQRPTEDAEASAAARTDGVPLPVPVSYAFAQGMDGSGLRRLGGVNFPTEAAGPGGSVMVFQDPSLRGLAVGGQAARHPVAPGSMPPAAMADFAMDLLLGSGGPARASSMRTSSWSDDGQQAAGGNAGSTLAGTFERNIMEAFRARTAAQAPAEPAAATPAAAPATDASAAPAGTIASQLDGAAQGSDGNQPAGPSQPAAAGPSSTSMPPPAEPSAAAEATPSQPQQSAASADAPNSAEVSPAPASLPSLESSPADEDEEMMDAEEGGDEDAEAGGGEEVSSAMAEAAAAVGIDLAFLQALPAELRGEVLAAHGAEMPSEAPAAPAAPTDPQAAAAEAATQLAQAAAAAFGLSAAAGRPQPMEGQEASAQPLQPSRDVSVPNPATSAPADVPMESQPESEAAAAPSAAPHGDGQQPSTAAQPAAPAQPEQPPDEMDGIDPEFIAALPPDIQAEVLEQQRRERRRRAAERQRAAAAQAAAAAGNAGGQGAGGAAPGAIGPAEMDLATLLATFPPEVREEVLLSDDAVLSSLPPALLAEAQALRDRSMRFMSGMGRGLAGRHVHHIHELPIGRGGAQMGSSAMLSRALAGVGRGQAPNAPGDRSSAPSRQIAVGPPLVDEEDLSVLASLLYMPMTSKTQLQRVFSNAIINHSTTRSQALRILLAFLRSTSPPTPRFGEPAPAAFGMQALQVQSSTSEEGPELEVSPPMSRRTLELLVYLARHQPRLAREIPFQLVPGPPTEQIPVVEDKKGKGKAAEKPHIPEAKAMEVLLTLLGLPLFRRSNAHLEQALQLLDTTFHAAYTAILERKRIQEANAKLKKDKEAAAKKMEEERAQEAKAAETRSQDSQSEPAQPSASATEQVPQESYAAAGAQPPTAGTAAGDQQPVVVESRAGAQPAAGNGGTAEAGPLGSSAAASPTPQPEQSQPLPDDPAPVLESLPEQLVRRLPQLLGQRGCTELAYSKCTAAMMHLVHCAKRHKAIMLAELEADLLRISDGAVAELHRLAQSDLQDPALGVDVGTTESAASAAEAAASGAGPSRSREQEVHDQGLVDRIAQRSSPLWVALSECIGRIEAGLKSPGGAGDTAATSRVLPPGAAQVLPLVEAFFVLCDARTAHLPPLPELSPARSLEQQLPSVPATPAGSAATPAQHPHGTPTAASAPVNEAHLPFLRFAEKHRKLLNTLLRVNSGLLEGSLKPLLKVPRLIDFDNKRSYFRSRARSTHHEERGHYGTLRINVRREHVFEDSFHQLRMKPPGEMRAKLSVQFHGEEGIDAGGVSRECHLDFFKFVGRIVGKALYDGQFIDAYFTRSFYKHMLMQPLTYQDIEAVDPEYFKNLAWMLENDITDILDLTFTEESDYFGKKELVELKPGGTTIKVTNANKREYVNLIAQHRMTTAIRGQINAFLTGFWDLIPKELISIFNDHELELLISGLPEIDVSDLRRNTEYSGYTAASKTIQWFWEVVQGLDKEDLALLVQFVTGTSKVPLDGFKALQGISGPQKFQIHKAYGPSARLPSAHTCFNQLDLLEYETQDQLKDRLLLALHEGAEGFGFG
ncbi:hypothetical protein WJX84_006185 [Apatococcus fuscideae]|uniref:HECT-type E3 ubiquitin transferase n=1 Tax=Apatococcus fuscideae TaxID=2026836 RepID=A0AAW1TBP1_9CHLO